MIKNHSICAVFLLLFLQIAAFAQEEKRKEEELATVQKTESLELCPNYSMPVIKAESDQNTSTILKPGAEVEHKLIIINPCVTTPAQKPNPLQIEPPLIENGNLEVSNAQPVQQNFVTPWKGSLRQNPVTAPAKPK